MYVHDRSCNIWIVGDNLSEKETEQLNEEEEEYESIWTIQHLEKFGKQ